MQQSSPKKNHLKRTGAVLLFALCLTSFIPPPAFAREPVISEAAYRHSPVPLLVAMADPPDFLAPAPTCKKEQRKKGPEGAITPFIGSRQVLTLLPTPERPTIASVVVPLERPEVTAGVDVDLGTVKFNLGYTLPASKVDNFVRPFGVDLEPGSDDKCISLGVKIPF